MQFIELLETGTPNIDFSGHSENTFRIINFSVPPNGLWQVYVNHFMQWVKTMWVKFSSVSLKALSAVFGEWAYQLYFPESCKG